MQRGMRLPPGPSRNALFRFFRHNSAYEFACEMIQQYGPTTAFRLGPVPVLVTQSAEVIDALLRGSPDIDKRRVAEAVWVVFGTRETIITMPSGAAAYGEKHATFVSALNPDRFPHFSSIVRDKLDILGQEMAQGAAPVNLSRAITNFTTHVAAKFFTGADLVISPLDFYTIKYELVEMSLARASQLFKVPDRFYLPARKRRKIVRNVMLAQVEAHRALPPEQRQGTYLAQLLQNANVQDGDPVPNSVLVDLMVAISVTSDPPDKLLSYLLYFLSQNRDAEEQVLREARNFSFELLGVAARQPYVHAAILETARLTTPYALLTRHTPRPLQVGGYDLPAKSMLILLPQAAHLDPVLYPNPQQFEPSRFIKNPALPLFAFGGGLRSCLGRHFMIPYAAAVATQLLQRFRFDFVKGRNHALRFMGTQQPIEDFMVTLSPRARVPMHSENDVNTTAAVAL